MYFSNSSESDYKLTSNPFFRPKILHYFLLPKDHTLPICLFNPGAVHDSRHENTKLKQEVVVIERFMSPDSLFVLVTNYQSGDTTKLGNFFDSDHRLNANFPRFTREDLKSLGRRRTRPFPLFWNSVSSKLNVLYMIR